jgi:hypothetical protein
MTILSACQSAAVRLLGRRPAAILSSDGQFELELGVLANETAIAIAKAHDWQKLKVLHTISGDGSDTSFALPAAYDRMPLKAAVWSTATSTPLTPARDDDQWLDFQLTSIVGSPGFWRILGGEMQILPAMSASETAKFYYVSNKLWIVDGGTVATKTEATVDTDTCVLPERLIALGVIWRWLQLKGKEYGEALRNFELAFSEEAGRDKGSRILAIGTPRIAGDVQVAYPGAIS